MYRARMLAQVTFGRFPKPGEGGRGGGARGPSHGGQAQQGRRRRKRQPGPPRPLRTLQQIETPPGFGIAAKVCPNKRPGRPKRPLKKPGKRRSHSSLYRLTYIWHWLPLTGS